MYENISQMDTMEEMAESILYRSIIKIRYGVLLKK